MSPATETKLTRPLLQRHQQRILHLETRRNHVAHKPNLPHHHPPRQAGICRTMRICWTQDPNPKSRYGVWQKDRTSSVSPRGIGHRVSDGYPGKGVRVGKEGRKREGRDNLEPMDWPTKAKKRPQGDYPRGREGNETLSYSRPNARADKSIKRKQRKHKARKPKARRMGFTVKHGQRFRREGSRKRSPVSKDYSTVEWIDPASLRKRTFRAIGARLRGGLRPRIVRGGRVLSGFRARRMP